MPAPLTVTFAAGPAGLWNIDGIAAVSGETLPMAHRLSMTEGVHTATVADTAWSLRGVTSHARYTHAAEVAMLAARQPGLQRPQASCAALIPIRKTEAWWALAQDERRHIMEARSQHIAIGLDYLPAIARRLHHCRELGGPFDFLTWFEYAPEHAAQFEALLERLRSSEEWGYVDREVDVRLSRAPQASTIT